MRFLLASAAALLCIACGPDTDANEEDCEIGAVTVSHAWTKPARAGQKVAAAYMTICNGAEEADALVGVDFDGAAAVEIHVSKMTDDVMSMSRVNRVDLPAGARATFAPGGMHVMIIGLNEEISASSPPILRFEFENSEDIETVLEVRAEGDQSHEQHH